MGTWIVRERCYWREKGWEPGETIEIDPYQGKKWELNGSVWLPEGTTVVDEKATPLMINWCLEPLDMTELKDENDVLMARNRDKQDRTYKHKSELEEEVPYKEMPRPKPLTPQDIQKIKVEGPEVLRTRKPKSTKKTTPKPKDKTT